MRSIWSGSLGFGLVNIPIKVYSASKERELEFDMLHKKDLSPIRFARICRSDGKEIPYDEIVKGYEYQSGDYVVLQDEDFKKASVKKTKTIEIVDFVKESEIDVVYFDKPYYLEPDKSAGKAYAVLVEALRKSGKVGVAKFVIRNRERLGIVKPMGNIIVLDQMRYKDEVREADIKVPEVSVSSREIDMALALIDQLTDHFKPEKYHDTYSEELEHLIKEKAKGHEIVAKDTIVEPPTKVNDLMAVLKESLEKTKASERPHVSATTS